MLKQRRESAQDIAKRLFEAEAAIDLAITRASELAGCMPDARQRAKLSAVVGQDAMESAASILPALALARQHVVKTHQRLDEAKTQIGLGAVAFGTPDDKAMLATGVRLVEDAA